MELILIIVAVALGAISLITNFVLIAKNRRANNVDVLSEQKKLFDEMTKKYEDISKRAEQMQKFQSEAQANLIKAYNENIVESIGHMSKANEKELSVVSQKVGELVLNNESPMQELLAVASEK